MDGQQRVRSATGLSGKRPGDPKARAFGVGPIREHEDMTMRRSLRFAAGCLVAGVVAAVLSAGEPAAEHSQPPGYRGPGTGGVYPARGLLRSWPTGGPDLLWKVPLGVAAAPITVWDDKVYAVAGRDAWLHVFALDGKPLGKARLGSASWKRFGFPRSTPLIAEGVAVGTTPNANIYGVDLKTMELRWKVNAWTDFGSGKGNQGWGLPESPILHGSLVIFNPVSRDDVTPPIIAVDIRDARKVVWGMDAGRGKFYSASDVSAALFNHKGRNLIVSPTWCYVVCLDADTGKVLWEIPSVGQKTLTPVYQDGMLLVSLQREMAAEGERKWPAWPCLPIDPPYRPSDAPTQPAPVTLRGKMRQTKWGPDEMVMLRLSDDGVTASVQWVRRDCPGRFSHAVLLNGRVYCFGNPDSAVEQSKDGSLPPVTGRARGSRRSSLLCLDGKTGKVIASAPADTPGHVVAAEGMVYAVDLLRIPDPHDPTARSKQAPRVRLLFPTAKGFEVTGELRPFSYHDAPQLRDGEWEASVPPVIAEGRLFLKYGPLMAFNLRRQEYERLPAPPLASAPPLAPDVRFPTTSVATIRPQDVPALLKQLGSRLEAHRRAAAALLNRREVAKTDDLARKLADLMTSGGEEAWLTQASASEAFAAMGPKARAAVPVLQKALPAALARRDGTLGRLILGAMRGIDDRAAEGVSGPVGALLTHADPYVQYLSAGLLRRMGPAGKGGAVALGEAMRSRHAQVRHEAGAALCAIGPAAKEAIPPLRTALMEALQKKRGIECGLIMAAFDKIDPEGVKPVVPRIAALLRDEDADLRGLAAKTLGQAGAAGAAGIPGLVQALGSDDQEVLALASTALAEMESEANSAAEALAKVIGEGKGATRVTAAEILGRMGPRAAPAVGALVKAVGDEDLALARGAAKALGAVGPGAKGAVGALVEALRHKDTLLVRAAAAALGAIGPDAKPAAEALLPAMKHPDTSVRANAAASLTQVGLSPVPAILEMLKTGSSRDQQWAAGALAGFPDDAKDTVPALVDALGSTDERLASSAISAIRTLGPGAKDAVPALVKLTRSADTRQASYALSAIGQIGPDAKAAVPALIKLIQSKDNPLITSAIHALSGIGPDAEPAVTPLVALSRGGDQRLAGAVRQTLDRIKTKNVAPKAQDVTATCLEGRSVAIDLPVTDDDDVVEYLGVRIERYPSGGSVQRGRAGNKVTYYNNPGFVGKDTFLWQVSDQKRATSRLATATVTVTPDTAGPRISEVTVPLGENEAVIVSFDEPVTAETATKAENYSIDPGVRVLKAVLHDSGTAVTLTTTELSGRRDCKLTAKGISDRAKAANLGGGTAGFVYRPLVAGLTYKYYEQVPQLDPKSRDVGDYDALQMKPKTTGVTAKVHLPVAKPAKAFTVRLDGVIDIPRRSDGAAYGEYTFSTLSTGHSRMFLDGKLVVDNRGGGTGREAERDITLAAGRHPFTVVYCQSGGSSPVLKASWSGPSIAKQEIPPAVLSHLAEP